MKFEFSAVIRIQNNSRRSGRARNQQEQGRFGSATVSIKDVHKECVSTGSTVKSGVCYNVSRKLREDLRRKQKEQVAATATDCWVTDNTLSRASSTSRSFDRKQFILLKSMLPAKKFGALRRERKKLSQPQPLAQKCPK